MPSANDLGFDAVTHPVNESRAAKMQAQRIILIIPEVTFLTMIGGAMLGIPGDIGNN